MTTLGIILFSAWLGIGAHHGLCSIIRAFDPRTITETKSALRLYNVITKLPAAMAVLIYVANCLSILLISLVAWPYFLMRDLLLAAKCALRPRDLFRRLNTYKDLRVLESTPGRSAVTARMPLPGPTVIPLPRPHPDVTDAYLPAPELAPGDPPSTETITRPDTHTRKRSGTSVTQRVE